MAPIKFEEQIKDKLEKRTVAPSSEAWSKLSQQLDVEDKRNKKSSFWWFGIAASIAALVLVSIAYFGQEDETSIDAIIVKDNLKDVLSPTKDDKLIDTNTTLEKEVIATHDVEEEISENNVEQETPASVVKKKTKANLDKAVVKPITNAVAKVEQQELQKEGKLKAIPNDLQLPVEDIELKSVVAVLEKINTERKNIVTDQQIDSLLKSASRELLMDKALKKGNNVVDADALLKYAEEDLGQSFRTRIYEVLKSGFNEVKTAVANRNN